AKRLVVEEIRRRVRDRVLRRVEAVGPFGCVQRISNRDLVADDERHGLVALEQPAEPLRVAPGCVVEALAAGERIGARVDALPRPVLVEGLALELPYADVVEERLDHERNGPPLEDELGGLAGALKARVDAEIDPDAHQLMAEPYRFGPSLLGQGNGHGRVAVHPPGLIQGGIGVAGQYEKPHGEAVDTRRSA